MTQNIPNFVEHLMREGQLSPQQYERILQSHGWTEDDLCIWRACCMLLEPLKALALHKVLRHLAEEHEDLIAARSIPLLIKLVRHIMKPIRASARVTGSGIENFEALATAADKQADEDHAYWCNVVARIEGKHALARGVVDRDWLAEAIAECHRYTAVHARPAVWLACGSEAYLGLTRMLDHAGWSAFADHAAHTPVPVVDPLISGFECRQVRP